MLMPGVKQTWSRTVTNSSLDIIPRREVLADSLTDLMLGVLPIQGKKLKRMSKELSNRPVLSNRRVLILLEMRYGWPVRQKKPREGPLEDWEINLVRWDPGLRHHFRSICFSEKLANTERHLDIAKGFSQRADDKTDELKKLNRSIFRPAITWNKDAKRAAQDAKIQARFDDERDQREKAMSDIRDTQNRLGKAGSYGRDDNELIGGNRRMLSAGQQKDRTEQRKRFQFEATASDDEMEDELDDNLNEISDVTKRLKALGTVMGQELDRQNERIVNIGDKTDGLDRRIFNNTERVSPIQALWFINVADWLVMSTVEEDQISPLCAPAKCGLICCFMCYERARYRIFIGFPLTIYVMKRGHVAHVIRVTTRLWY